MNQFDSLSVVVGSINLRALIHIIDFLDLFVIINEILMNLSIILI